MERALLTNHDEEVIVEAWFLAFLKRLALWQVGLLLIACSGYLYVEQHWLSGRYTSHMALMPMVSVEQFGIFGMALGIVVVVVGLARALFVRRHRAGESRAS